MSGQKGRECLIKVLLGGVLTTMAGIRTVSFTHNENQVDVTDQVSAGRWRELLAAAGVQSIDISGSGVFKTNALQKQMMTWKLSGVFPSCEVTIPGLGTLSGPFMISQLDHAGNHDGEVTWSLGLASAGEITFAAAA